MSFKVVIVYDLSQVPSDFPEKIRGIGAEVSMKDYKTEDEWITFCHDADFIFTVLAFNPIGRRQIEHLEKCRFVETVGVGYGEIDLKAATEHGIGVIHNPGFCGEELSDHAMALILACSRWIVGLDKIVKEGNPVTPASPQAMAHLSILKGRTLGLIGFGNSGRAIVPKALGFGMRTIVYEGHADRRVAQDLGVEVVSLDRLLKEADFISIHANLTPETKQMIGLEEFKKMKRSAVIINTSRGAIINETDLHTALTEGYIAGAGLDVTDPEPIAADSPLMELDNVILTGHNAGGSQDSYDAMWNFPIEEIGRVIRGEWPLGLVNPEVKPKYVEKWGQMSETGK